jgi:hypothetical protein
MERQPDTPMTGNVMTNESPAGSTPQSGSEGVVEQAKQTVANVANQAKGQATEKVQSSVSQGKERTARALGAVAESLRSAGNDLRGRDEGMIGQFIDRAADRASRIADHLNNRDPNALLDDLENYARREPAVFLGGAFVVGLIAARFLKSSRGGNGRQMDTAQPISRAVAPVPTERDVTNSLVHRDSYPNAGPSGPSTI